MLRAQVLEELDKIFDQIPDEGEEEHTKAVIALVMAVMAQGLEPRLMEVTREFFFEEIFEDEDSDEQEANY